MSFTPPGWREMVQKPRRRFIHLLLAIVVVISLGALGFHLIEGWPLADSLYIAVQTVTTVGYGDVTPASRGGRAFATIFMLVGVGTVLYALTSTVQSVVESELLATLGMRRRYREMRKLENHFIICGAGRVGSRIIREMRRAGASFVVIEQDAPKVAHLLAEGVHVIVSDATLEETLKEAGVERARGLAACLPDDADNLYVVLIARDLNRSLHIVARAVEEQAEPKLIRAGANRVVAPTIIGSHRMAQALMKPAVADFMDSIAAESLDLAFEQVEVAPASVYVGKKLKELNIRSELDTAVVAIRKQDGDVLYHPTGDATIEANDILIVIGRTESLSELIKRARGSL
ncbi:MAG TPA: potassium channel protein [Pyrinomonadaceae bacterium]|jgi:voltage-gated potassium channel